MPRYPSPRIAAVHRATRLATLQGQLQQGWVDRGELRRAVWSLRRKLQSRIRAGLWAALREALRAALHSWRCSKLLSCLRKSRIFSAVMCTGGQEFGNRGPRTPFAVTGTAELAAHPSVKQCSQRSRAQPATQFASCPALRRLLLVVEVDGCMQGGRVQ